METHLYILCGLAGVLAHTLLKYQGLRTDAEKANASLSVGRFLVNDWVGIVLSGLAVFVWYAVYGEVTEKYPQLHGFTRLTFFAVGGMGSYAFQLVFSKAKRKVRAAIDEGTGAAEEKVPIK